MRGRWEGCESRTTLGGGSHESDCVRLSEGFSWELVELVGAVLGLSTAGVRSIWMNGDLVVLGRGRRGIGVVFWKRDALSEIPGTVDVAAASGDVLVWMA